MGRKRKSLRLPVQRFPSAPRLRPPASKGGRLGPGCTPRRPRRTAGGSLAFVGAQVAGVSRGSLPRLPGTGVQVVRSRETRLEAPPCATSVGVSETGGRGPGSSVLDCAQPRARPHRLTGWQVFAKLCTSAGDARSTSGPHDCEPDRPAAGKASDTRVGRRGGWARSSFSVPACRYYIFSTFTVTDTFRCHCYGLPCSVAFVFITF